ncbi:MAG: hypothetical protein GY743_23390 [Planctomycetaceae bacterium]|nr:hypothetical protein [Planctomycetaceae bacterium]
MTITDGTPFELNAGGADAVGASTLDSNNAITVYTGNSNHLAKVVQSDETEGAEFTIGALSAAGGYGTLGVAALSSTKAISLRQSTGSAGAKAKVLSISGTTITAPGNDPSLGGSDPRGIAIAALSSTAAIGVYADDSASYVGKANYLTISGNTITDQSSVTFEASAGLGVDARVAICELTATKAVVVYSDGDDSNKLKAVVLSVSGTTISAGSAVNIDGTDAGTLPSLAPISTTSCLLVYNNSTDTDFKAVVLSGMSATTVTVNTAITVNGAAVTATGVAAYSASQFLATYKLVDDTGNYIELAVSGVTVSTVGSSAQFDTGLNEAISCAAYDSDTAIAVYLSASIDAVIFSLATGSHIWLSTDGAATFSNIGDSAWGSNVVGGVVVAPGTAYQTIFAAVGTNLYKTTNGGGAWSLETAIGYEVDFIDLEKDHASVFMAKRDAGGANRASVWDGASLTHINTGKSTTGGATSGGDVV